jgi:hypothetical protein
LSLTDRARIHHDSEPLYSSHRPKIHYRVQR